MSFIKHSSFLTTTYEQVENHYTHKNELIQILSENNIQHKVHLSVLKLYNASFMQIETQKSNVNNHSQKVLNAIRNCIDIKTLDLSDCTNIPKIVEDFPYLNTIIFPVFLYFIPRIKKCPSILKISFPKKGVTRIESSNFKNYPSIDELILDENLISIDSFAFYASSIKRVNLSKCENLDSKKINEKAFSDSSIEEIVLPQQVNILPFGAFFNCQHLRTITGSNLLATYTDNSKTNAVQFDRAVHSCEFCFEKCINLQFIQFSPKLSIDGIKRLLCHSGYKEEKNTSDSDAFYYDKRCGIVIEIDKFNSYIWCFTDFSFYISKKLDDTFLNQIVSFYNSNTRNIEMEDGKCWIDSTHRDHIALGVSLGCNYHFNKKFNKEGTELGTCTIKNDQNKALDKYKNVTFLKDIDIKTKLHELEKHIDDLDIDSIIDSYHSTREYHHIYSSDDDEQLNIYRKASYSDSYLETLLPSQYYEYERGFADSNNYKLESMTEIELKNDDKIIKENAREKYDKEEHKRLIINKFIIDSIENEKFIEKCLRINEAKKLLKQFENSVDGYQKIILLNSKIQS